LARKRGWTLLARQPGYRNPVQPGRGGALASAFIPTFTTILTRITANAPGDCFGHRKFDPPDPDPAFHPGGDFRALDCAQYPGPGFASDPEKEALTISLLRLMLPSAVIFGLSGW